MPPAPRGLVYVSDQARGIRSLRRPTPKKAPSRFHYLGPSGRRIRDARTLARIARLAIPPAYEDVWICANPKGHLQATGRDARGRKQYRYHPDWSSARDDHKHSRMLSFGKALRRLRAGVRRDLKLPGLSREKVPVPKPRSDLALRRCINAVVKDVAAGLRSTPAVCRKSYINPALFTAWQNGQLRRRAARGRPAGGAARTLLALLEKGQPRQES